MKRKILFFVSALLLSLSLHLNAQNEADYTVPSWTLYQRSVVAGSPDTNLLVSKDHPYNVNVTVNGDPSKQFGAAWFTNDGVTGGKLQLVEGKTSDAASFTDAKEFTAVSTEFKEVNYVSAGNNNAGLIAKTNYSKGDKRSYTSNKVLIDGLKPNTTYSYRVGGVNGAWSEIGSFTTAKNNKDDFEFIYITDTQANTDEMFDVSAKTVAKAFEVVPEAKFLLICGDLVESSGNNSAEWEWEQWFEKMQKQWYHSPIVPIQGNHDTSPFSNWSYHFNTDTSYNASQSDNDAKTAMEGTVYSFVYGDALFMIFNYEDYKKGETYFSALETWMENQVAAHPDVKWKIAVYHKTMFTGSNSHQNDGDGRIVRERFAKVFQRLGINLALQGHDHIYEVIGVVATDDTTFTHLPSAIKGQTLTEGGSREDMTGIHGGSFDTTDGVVYFLNNSAGKKKYEPRTEAQMNAAITYHGITDYYKLFNRFGQTGEPTFSRMQVSSDAIKVSTYTVSEAGESSLFDAFEIVKGKGLGINEPLNPNDQLIIYQHDQQIVVESKKSVILSVELYDFSGRNLYHNHQINSHSIRIPSAQFGKQILIVRVQTEKGEIITRKVINE